MKVQYFFEHAYNFKSSDRIVYQWNRKASQALRQGNVERFHECMALSALWSMQHYKKYHYGRSRILECWKNFVYHYRAFNAEYMA